jgi:hypothetical protein
MFKVVKARNLLYHKLLRELELKQKKAKGGKEWGEGYHLGKHKDIRMTH